MAFEAALVRALVEAFARRLILSAHDISLGGPLVTVAEMVIASGPFDVGARLSLGGVSKASTCFSEMGGVVVEVGEASWEELRALLDDHRVTWVEIGSTQAAPAMDAELADGSFSVSLADLRDAHTGQLAQVLYG
jgi:phosphoribosylformylglycinamidine (FGAM) synthase-like enzyme